MNIFNQCLSDAYNIGSEGDWCPELDNLHENTVADVMYKVLHQWDMVAEGEIRCSKQLIKNAEAFFRKWRDYIELENEKEKRMYTRF
jgi:hemerythrin-like domain-containing protein